MHLLIIRAAGKGRYIIYSHKGKRLSKPMSKGRARKRLAQIEWFKRHKVVRRR